MTSLKKRKLDNDEMKKVRLAEAVSACKNGRMSQAAASVAFDIPKTTIWRRLQQEASKNCEKQDSETLKRKTNSAGNEQNKFFEEGQIFEFCEVVVNFGYIFFVLRSLNYIECMEK